MRRGIVGLRCVTLGLAVAMGLTGCGQGGRPQASAPPTTSASTSTAATGPQVTRGVTTLGVLGDSISLGVNACGEFGECEAASWAMGTDATVDSLATRIGQQTGHRPAVANGAVSGGTVATLLQSVHAVVAAKPQLVTVLIGANDACGQSVAGMTSVADFQRDYGQVLDTVLDSLPHARVLAMSVPDLYRLWQVGQSDPAIAQAWSMSGTCGVLLSGSGSATASAAERRDAVRQRVQDYNRAIAQLCSARPRCISDGGAVYAHSFTSAQLSDVDYFHPSRAGQQKIAELAWAALQRAR